MRPKLPLILSLLTLMALSPAIAPRAAQAGEDEADYNQVRTGIIRSVDPANHVLVLDDGMRFVTWRAPDVEVDLSGLQPGTRINAYYVVRNGTNILTAYEFP